MVGLAFFCPVTNVANSAADVVHGVAEKGRLDSAAAYGDGCVEVLRLARPVLDVRGEVKSAVNGQRVESLLEGRPTGGKRRCKRLLEGGVNWHILTAQVDD